MCADLDIRDSVAEALIQASTTFGEDQKVAYRRALQIEKNPNSKWVLEKIIENAETAERSHSPLCDDTGIPHVFLEIGEDVRIPMNFFRIVEEGVRKGLQKLPGRPMAVKGGDLERMGQNKGLYSESDMVVAAPFQVRNISGSKNRIRVTVLMLGGGPDIRAKTLRIFHRHEGMNVLEEAAEWAAAEVKNLGCTPTIPIIGVGRTHYEATCMMLEAMKEGSLIEQSPLEARVTEIVNKTKVGPLGLGGETTALASLVRIGPLRAGGTRMVSMRLGCCWEPRRATREIAV